MLALFDSLFITQICITSSYFCFLALMVIEINFGNYIGSNKVDYIWANYLCKLVYATYHKLLALLNSLIIVQICITCGYFFFLALMAIEMNFGIHEGSDRVDDIYVPTF